MVFGMYADNSEFAASTGDNANNGGDYSTFDYPATSTKDGDTTLEDAVALRQDSIMPM